MTIRFLPFRFRDVEAPFQDRRVGFVQDVARHPILFRDLKEIEMLGADNLTISYTLPMDDAANLGRWRDVNLYTDVLPKLVQACYDRRPGTLFDPIWREEITVVPLSYQESAGKDVSRSGVRAQIEFLLYPEDLTLPITDLSFASIATIESGTLDLNTSLEGVTLPDDPPTGDALVNPLELAQSFIDQGELYAEQISGQLVGYAGQLEELAESIEKASDPIAWQALPTVRQLQFSAQQTARSAGGILANVVTFTVRQDITLNALALELGADRDLLLRFNQRLARLPLILAGTEVKFPQP